MKRKCNLSKLFNEFNVSVKREVYGLTTFNGYVRAKNYNAHINEIVSNFRHDMCYQLAFENNVRKEVLLQNLNKDLIEKEILLERKFALILKRYCNCSSKTKLIDNILNEGKCRRLKYMYYCQKNGIARLIQILHISAKSFNINLSEPDAIKKVSVCNSKWSAGKLSLIQLIVAQIHSNNLETDIENEHKTIKEIAHYFGVEYNHTLETSLIHSIFDRKDGYEPKIFDELKTAYKDYENLRKKRNRISRV